MRSAMGSMTSDGAASSGRDGVSIKAAGATSLSTSEHSLQSAADTKATSNSVRSERSAMPSWPWALPLTSEAEEEE